MRSPVEQSLRIHTGRRSGGFRLLCDRNRGSFHGGSPHRRCYLSRWGNLIYPEQSLLVPAHHVPNGPSDGFHKPDLTHLLAQ